MTGEVTPFKKIHHSMMYKNNSLKIVMVRNYLTFSCFSLAWHLTSLSRSYDGKPIYIDG